mmetsp:Transcript_169023/g.537041  ORF Transcript_169023/g.537041 Transcript_169023/m.537041 type:complete len:111 (-) Transcript_169023:279-611(-)
MEHEHSKPDMEERTDKIDKGDEGAIEEVWTIQPAPSATMVHECSKPDMDERTDKIDNGDEAALEEVWTIVHKGEADQALEREEFDRVVKQIAEAAEQLERLEGEQFDRAV